MLIKADLWDHVNGVSVKPEPAEDNAVKVEECESI